MPTIESLLHSADLPDSPSAGWMPSGCSLPPPASPPATCAPGPSVRCRATLPSASRLIWPAVGAASRLPISSAAVASGARAGGRAGYPDSSSGHRAAGGNRSAAASGNAGPGTRPGTGTGAIALALAAERPQWQVSGVDRIEAASRARRTQSPAPRTGQCPLRTQRLVRRGDGERFQLIVSNPPYIPASDPHLQQGDVRFEPQSALVAGWTGWTTSVRSSPRLPPI